MTVMIAASKVARMPTEYKTIRIWKSIVDDVDKIVKRFAAGVAEGNDSSGVTISRSHVLRRAIEALEAGEKVDVPTPEQKTTKKK